MSILHLLCLETRAIFFVRGGRCTTPLTSISTRPIYRDQRYQMMDNSERRHRYCASSRVPVQGTLTQAHPTGQKQLDPKLPIRPAVHIHWPGSDHFATEHCHIPPFKPRGRGVLEHVLEILVENQSDDQTRSSEIRLRSLV